jgi:hypothetical protein
VKHDCTKRGSLKFITGFAGTSSAESAQLYIPPYTYIYEETSLHSFRKSDGDFFTILDLTNVTELSYEYGLGSFDSPNIPAEIQSKSFTPFTVCKRVSGFDRGKIHGSFVIYLNAKDAKGNKVIVGREPMLSRWQTAGCLNCQTYPDAEVIFPIDENTLNRLKGAGKDGLQTTKDSSQELEFRGTVGTPEEEHKGSMPCKVAERRNRLGNRSSQLLQICRAPERRVFWLLHIMDRCLCLT